MDQEQILSQTPIRIAIVGRPNVGKSALFNRLIGKRVAIVDDEEGVTRDRIYGKGEFFGRPFEVIDTGGLCGAQKLPFQEEVRQQTEIAIEEADSLIFVVDGTTPPTLLDEELAKMLLKKHKKVVLAVNKIDDRSSSSSAPFIPYYSLGIKDMVAVSAQHGYHVTELLEEAMNNVDPEPRVEMKREGIKVAIVGRPNVGKSTLLNFLIDEERSIVSPIAGTTRDPVDIAVEHEGSSYVFIDTAGIRRKQKELEVVEKFAHIRTERIIEAADVCILLLDSREGMTVQEKKIANYIEEQGKGCILLFNKWDLVKGFRMEHCLQAVRQQVPFLEHCPAIFGSALHGRNIEKIFGLIQQVYEGLHTKISTGKLNRMIEKSLQKYHPPMIKGKRLRIYYLTQTSVNPPQFLLFVNYPDLMAPPYKKYLLNELRKEFGFIGVPIVFSLKPKKQKTLGERLEEKHKEAVKAQKLEEESDFHYEESFEYEEEFIEE